MSDSIRYALEEESLLERLSQIQDEYRIDTVVETGIDVGSSAIKFCELFTSYVGIDIDPVCIEKTRARLNGSQNWKLIQGNSPEILKSLTFDDNTLFFLDAHCYQDTECPILDEIKALPKGQGVLIFHDIEVPGREHGAFYPVIEGKKVLFSYDVIREELLAWSPAHRIEYLMEYSHEKNPGVMFVYPK